MHRRVALVLVAAVTFVLATGGVANAHPLGNFTVNHYAGIELAGDRVYVRYTLDLAEIPTFQFGADVRAPGFPATVARQLQLRVDGSPGSRSGPWSIAWSLEKAREACRRSASTPSSALRRTERP